jgi:hypothetical protein
LLHHRLPVLPSTGIASTGRIRLPGSQAARFPLKETP